MKKIILITGSNRGIGLEGARQLTVKGHEVIQCSRSGKVGLPLDVTDDASAARAHDWVREKYGKLDVLVNNAGIFVDPEAGLRAEIDSIRQSMETNTYGALRMARTFAPLLKQAGQSRIINVSSGMGALDDMNGGYTGYRLSKTALNALTRILSEELGPQGTAVNSMCPGWVKTDMGGPGAEFSVEEGADTMTWLASEAPHSLTGKFFRSRKEIPW